MFGKIKNLLLGSLRKQLMLGMTLVIVSMMTLFLWNMTDRQLKEEIRNHSQQVSALAESAATSSEVLVASRDYSGLQEIVLGISRYPDLRYVLVLDQRGQVLAHSDPSKIGLFLTDLPQQQEQTEIFRTDSLVEVIAPITLTSKHIGWVRLGIDRSHFNGEVAQTRQEGFVYMLIGIALSLLIAFVASRYLTRRLAVIQRVADEVNAGNTTVRVVLSGDDEAARLAGQFNSMLDGLAQREAALKHSQIMMERTEKIAHMGSWEWEVDANIVTWSPEMFRILGRDPALGVPNLEGQAELYTPQTTQILFDAVTKAVAHGTPYKIELMTVQPDGEQRPCIAIGFPESDASGRVVRLNGLLQDITERKKSEESLKANEERMRIFFDNVPLGIFSSTREGKFTYVNPALPKMLGYDSSEEIMEVVNRTSVAETLYVEAPRRDAIMRELDQDVNHWKTFENRYRRKDGQIIDAIVSIGERHDPATGEVIFDGIITDITARKHIEEELRVSEERFHALFDRASDGILILSPTGELISCNKSFARMHGYTQQEMQSLNLRDLDTPVSAWLMPERMRRIVAGEALTFEVENYRKDGSSFAMEVTASLVVSGGEQLIQTFSRDISERKIMEEQIRQLAFFDPLTKLPNRRMLNDRLTQALALSKRTNRYGAILFIDLDNFKPLNDHYGHDVGDLLLIEVAHRLLTNMREMDTVARFGGDEFVVMLNGLEEDKSESSALTTLVAEKILTTLSEPYELTVLAGGCKKSISHRCSASIGVAMFIRNEASSEELLKWADMAMYQAKDEGRNMIRFYTDKPEGVI